MSFEEFLQHMHPVPEEDAYFLDCWGYEQWHIRRFKQDFRQARIIYGNRYNMYTLVALLDGNPLEQYLTENSRPLVKAMVAWTGFAFRRVPAGAVGISIFERDGDHFCIFPKFSLEQYTGMCTPGKHIEVLDEVFESEDQVLALNEKALNKEEGCHVD